MAPRPREAKKAPLDFEKKKDSYGFIWQNN